MANPIVPPNTTDVAEYIEVSVENVNLTQTPISGVLTAKGQPTTTARYTPSYPGKIVHIDQMDYEQPGASGNAVLVDREVARRAGIAVLEGLDKLTIQIVQADPTPPPSQPPGAKKSTMKKTGKKARKTVGKRK